MSSSASNKWVPPDPKQGTLFDDDPRIRPIDARFLRFHCEHPEVYGLYRRFARELRRHTDRGSSEQIVQRLRWETLVNPDHEGDYKINDHFRRRYAMLLVRDLPGEFTGFFEFRKKRGTEITLLDEHWDWCLEIVRKRCAA